VPKTRTVWSAIMISQSMFVAPQKGSDSSSVELLVTPEHAGFLSLSKPVSCEGEKNPAKTSPAPSAKRPLSMASSVPEVSHGGESSSLSGSPEEKSEEQQDQQEFERETAALSTYEDKVVSVQPGLQQWQVEVLCHCMDKMIGTILDRVPGNMDHFLLVG